MPQPHTTMFEIPVEQPPAGTRRGWRAAGVELTAVPDPAYPFDPAIVRWMRQEFDEELMPLFIRRAYRNDNGTVRVAGFHCLATARWNPEFEPPPWTHRVTLRAVGEIRKPTAMVMHLEDRKARVGDGLPGAFLSFNERIYKGLRSLYQEWTAAEKRLFIEENDEAARAAKTREGAERYVEEKVAHDWRVIGKRFAGITRQDAYDAYEKLKEKTPFVTVPGDSAIETSLQG